MLSEFGWILVFSFCWIVLVSCVDCFSLLDLFRVFVGACLSPKASRDSTDSLACSQVINTHDDHNSPIPSPK